MSRRLLALAACAAVAAPATAQARVNRWKIVAPLNMKLDRMAMCESGNRPWLNTGNGYYGLLQFDVPTWRSVGGHGLPHWHPRIEQKYRAALLIRRRGFAPWPTCGTR